MFQLWDFYKYANEFQNTNVPCSQVQSGVGKECICVVAFGMDLPLTTQAAMIIIHKIRYTKTE